MCCLLCKGLRWVVNSPGFGWISCEHVIIVLVGFTGQIGYALVPMIARGVMLGVDQPLIVNMLDIPPVHELVTDDEWYEV